MNIPAELKYTKDHEWAKIENDTVLVGITDYAQSELGDVVYVELPEEGSEVKQGDSFGTIEAVKAVSDLYAPLSGKVLEVNTALEDAPETINQDPYGAGWMIKIQISDPSEINNLLDSAAYESLL